MRLICSVVLVLLVAHTALPQELSKVEKDAGFVPLFNGKSLDGWMGAKEDWFVEDSVLFCKRLVDGNGKPKVKWRTLETSGEYADFILRLDYLLEAGVNNGIGLRTDAKGKTLGLFEVQLLDYDHPKQKSGEEFRKTGSLVELVAAKQGAQKLAEQWNTMEIIAKGPRIQVVINGEQVVDTEKTPLPKKPDRGQFRTKGHIALLGHTGRAEFKNIRIKELK